MVLPAATATPFQSAQDLGAALRARRVACKLTQEDLGMAAGLTQAQVSRLEKGADGMGIGLYLQVAAALGYDLFGVGR